MSDRQYRAIWLIIFGFILFLSALVRCHAQPGNVAGATYVVSLRAGADIAQNAANYPTYTRFLLAPGVYNITNSVDLKTGQSIVGAGYGATFLRYWGYTSNAVQVLGNDWTAIHLNDNTYVADFDITNMFTGSTVFQAMIGRPAVTRGGTNFLVTRVSMHGDTDNFYIDNGSVWEGIISDCFFDSAWDTFATISLKGGSRLLVLNPVMHFRPPSASSPGSYAVAFRVAASGAELTERFVQIVGGSGNGSFVPLVNNGCTISFNGFHVNSTYTGTNVLSVGSTINGGVSLYDTPFPGNTLFSLTGGQSGSRNNLISTAPPQDSAMEESLYGDFLPGTLYYNTNLLAFRLFDGLAWKSIYNSGFTNQLYLSGSGIGTYDGIYTWKQATIPGTAGNCMVWTNLSGRFLLQSTNSTADAPLALSPNLSLSDGLEVVLNGSGQFERGWDTAAIRITHVIAPPEDFQLKTARAFTNGYYIAAIPKAYTSAALTTIFNVSCFTGNTHSFRVYATTRAINATDQQCRTDMFQVCAVNKAATVTTGITAPTTAVAVSTGTLTTVWTAVANGASVDVKCTATTSLGSPTATDIKYRIEFDGDYAAVITP